MTRAANGEADSRDMADALQAIAEEHGIVDAIGQDEVQRLIANGDFIVLPDPPQTKSMNGDSMTMSAFDALIAKEKAEKARKAKAKGDLTEDLLALRFSERHADELRYIAVKGEWRKWNGDHWKPEATLLAFDLARRCCRDIANGKFSAKTVAAVERMAKADRRHATTIEQWDANDMDFNTRGKPNGYVQS
jgi:D5 N terminal like